MTDTSQLKLPLLQPAQAQKHVTVNEALVRLDGLAQLVMQSQSTTTPPPTAADGTVYMLPAGSVNAWAGQDGKLAIASNGGWVFLAPQAGWRGYVADEALAVIHDGSAFVPDGAAQSPNGAKSETKIIEADHVFTAGTTNTTSLQIPQYASVTAVTGRIIADITGTLTDWSLGVAADPVRYASGLGLSAGSWVIGMSGSPLTYYADTALLLTANGGDFAGGTLRLAIHMQQFTPPAL